MSITSDRDVFIGAHFTEDQKEQFRLEASRRKMSMSALLAQVVGEWLVLAQQEQLEPKRSNKRDAPEVEAALAKEIDIPLPLEE